MKSRIKVKQEEGTVAFTVLNLKDKTLEAEMTRTERDEVKESLLAYMDEFLQKTQDSEMPFDCCIPDEAATLMRDAAFSVIEAIENTQDWMKREGYLDKAA